MVLESKMTGFFPSLWEGLGEGAKHEAQTGPLPRPLPKGEGEETFVGHLSLIQRREQL